MRLKDIEKVLRWEGLRQYKHGDKADFLFREVVYSSDYPYTKGEEVIATITRKGVAISRDFGVSGPFNDRNHVTKYKPISFSLPDWKERVAATIRMAEKGSLSSPPVRREDA